MLISKKLVLNFVMYFLICGSLSSFCFANPPLATYMLNVGFTRINFVPLNFQNSQYMLNNVQNTKDVIKNFCAKIDVYYKKYKWTEFPSCGDIKWQAHFQTIKQNPLIYAVFGKGQHSTLILGGVHGDEITTIPITFRLANYINNNKELIEKFDKFNVKVIIAPIVNPDGFLQDNPTRVNSNGVDLNRNFLTTDWYVLAKDKWINIRKRDPRVYPGYFPNSEIEVIFQIYLIDTFLPDKIISLHSPLGFLDYDGPGDRKENLSSEIEKKAKKLVDSISQQSDNYKVVDYDYYPGSLGNYAGNERLIPTITLELETSYPTKVEEYWRRFYQSLIDAVFYKVESTNKNSFFSMFKSLYYNDIKKVN